MKINPAPIEINKDYINNIDINGMSGRHIRLTPKHPASSQIIIFGGFLSSAEKHFGLLEYLRDYGTVNYLDLPGYGGMDSFYSIDQDSTVDNYGDYIYSVLKTLRLKGRPTIIALGSSIEYVNNLVSRYPTVASRSKEVLWIKGIDAVVNGGSRTSNSALLRLASKKRTVNRMLYKRLIGNTEGSDLKPNEIQLFEHLISANDLRSHLSALRGYKTGLGLNAKIVDVHLNAAYKNFKLYDKIDISELLGSNFENAIDA